MAHVRAIGPVQPRLRAGHMNNAPFTLGIIGAGGIANAHIGAAGATGGAIRIAAVADPNAANRESVAGKAGARSFASAEALLDQSKTLGLDAVVLCTPPSARLDFVRGALERGLHVLVEKPIAHTLRDAQSHMDLAEAFPRQVCAVGYCHRFTPAMQRMKSFAETGRLGTLARFENVFACTFPAMKDRWMSDPALSGGGSFIDTGCHSLDLFHYLVGPSHVEACVRNFAWPGRGESSATALVRDRENGVAGMILSGWLEPARFTVMLVGTEGSLFYDYEKPTELFFRRDDGPATVTHVETHELRFQRQLEGFVRACRGERVPDLATFREGLLTAQAVDEALSISAEASVG